MHSGKMLDFSSINWVITKTQFGTLKMALYFLMGSQK